MASPTLWTGSFARLKGRTVPVVSIAAKLPPGWKGVPVYKRLAPPLWIARLKDRPREFVREYNRHVLSKVNPEKVLDMLSGYVMLCSARPNEFCHRRIVAEWLERSTGVTVPEWGWTAPQLTVEEMIRGEVAIRPEEESGQLTMKI